MLKETLRSRWFSVALHTGLWLLLLFAAVGLGGRRAPYVEAEADAAAVQMPVPVTRLGGLFASENRPKQVFDPALQSTFATLYFTPPTVPVPIPTTRKVEITYQGYYQPAGGSQRAVMRVADLLVPVTVGGLVVSNLWVAEAAFQTLTLTNSAGQTNVLKMNVKQVVEVPLK